MPRSGSLSEWERRLAAQHRDEERLARERRQQEKEIDKARQQEHLESRQRTADEQTAAAAEQIESLDEVLTSVLALPPMSFDRLMSTPRTPEFDPGPLGVAQPDPDWSDFAPPRPGGLRWLLGGAARYKRQTAQAQDRFEAAAAEHRQHESQRRRALSVAKAKYHKRVTEIFSATAPDVVQAVSFTGHVHTTDRATGKTRPPAAAQCVGRTVRIRGPGPGRDDAGRSRGSRARPRPLDREIRTGRRNSG